MELNKSPDLLDAYGAPTIHSNDLNLITKRDLNEFSDKSLSNLELDISLNINKSNTKSSHTWLKKNILISPILNHHSTDMSRMKKAKFTSQKTDRNTTSRIKKAFYSNNKVNTLQNDTSQKGEALSNSQILYIYPPKPYLSVMLSPLGNKIAQSLLVSPTKTFLFAKKISLKMNNYKGKYFTNFYAFVISLAIYEQMDILEEYMRSLNISKFTLERLKKIIELKGIFNNKLLNSFSSSTDTTSQDLMFKLKINKPILKKFGEDLQKYFRRYCLLFKAINPSVKENSSKFITCSNLLEISANLNSMLNIDAHFFFKDSIINEVHSHKVHDPFLRINIFFGHKDCYILYTKSLWNKLIKIKSKGTKTIKNSERNLNGSLSQGDFPIKIRIREKSPLNDEKFNSFALGPTSKTFRSKQLLSLENIHSYNFTDQHLNKIDSLNCFYSDRKEKFLGQRSFFLSEKVDLFHNKNSNSNFSSFPYLKIIFKKKKNNFEVYSTDSTEIYSPIKTNKDSLTRIDVSNSVSTIPILSIKQIKEKVNQGIQFSDLIDKNNLEYWSSNQTLNLPLKNKQKIKVRNMINIPQNMDIMPSSSKRKLIIDSSTSMDYSFSSPETELKNKQKKGSSLKMEHALMTEITHKNYTNFQLNQNVFTNIHHIDLSLKKNKSKIFDILTTNSKTDFFQIKTDSLSQPLNLDFNDISSSEEITTNIEFKEVENIIKLLKS